VDQLPDDRAHAAARVPGGAPAGSNVGRRRRALDRLDPHGVFTSPLLLSLLRPAVRG